MTAPDRIARTLIKTLAKRGRPHMTKPFGLKTLKHEAVSMNVVLEKVPHINNAQLECGAKMRSTIH
jgi:hypothetical protein